MAENEEHAQPEPEAENPEPPKVEDAVPVEATKTEEGGQQGGEDEEAPAAVGEGGEEAKEEQPPETTEEPAKTEAPTEPHEVDSDEDVQNVPSEAKAKKKGKGKEKGGKKGKKKEPKAKSAESLPEEEAQDTEAEPPEATEKTSSKTKAKGGKGKKGKGKKGKKSKSQEEIEQEESGKEPTEGVEPQAVPPAMALSEAQMEDILENYYKSTEDFEKHKKRSKSKASSLDVQKQRSSKSDLIADDGDKTRKHKKGGKDDKKLKHASQMSSISVEPVEQKQSQSSTRGSRRKMLSIVESDSKFSAFGSVESIGSSSSTSSSNMSEGRRKSKRKKNEQDTQLQQEAPKAKGKKDKKGGKKMKKERSVTIVDDALTVTESQLMMQELQKMKAGVAEEEVASITTQDATPQAAPKKKKGKGKKAPADDSQPQEAKKGKRMSNKQMQEWLIQQELEAQRKAEEERLRLEKEKQEMIEQEMIERYEQITRKEQLQPSIDLAEKLNYEDSLADLDIADEEEWVRYLRCDGLPKVTDSGEMYTYLYRMDLTREQVGIDEAAAKTNEILGLLNTLEKRITNPLMYDTTVNIARWKEIRQEFRNAQQDRLDTATYRLLRNVFGNLTRRSIPLSDYSRIEENFILCLWVAVCLPTHMPNPRRPPKPRASMDFHEMEIKVLLPQGFNYDLMSVRGMYLRYDHISDLCDSYDEPEMPPILKIDLIEASEQEYVTKIKTSFQVFDRRKKPKPKKKQQQEAVITSETGEPEEVEKKEEVVPEVVEVPVEAFDDETCLGYNTEIPLTVEMLELKFVEPPVKQLVVEIEDLMYQEALQSLAKDIELPTINLRQYAILGGVYCVDLYHQPPQPREMVGNETELSTLMLPKKLTEVDFYVQYVPPNIVNDGTKTGPEIQEEELKYQEAEFEKLIYITINLPKHVIWVAPPKVCQWDKTMCHWTTKDVYGEKYNEEKQFIEFRTGRFGIFGMAVFKYPNLPYQSWDILPQKK